MRSIFFTPRHLFICLVYMIPLVLDFVRRGMQYHQTAVVPRESILRTEVEWLNSIKADLVVGYHDHRIYFHEFPNLTLPRIETDQAIAGRFRMLYPWRVGRLQMRASAPCASPTSGV